MSSLYLDKLKKKESFKSDDVLKVTALSYLEETLIKEQYELCADLIKAAKEYGADKKEVQAVLAQHIGKRIQGGEGTRPHGGRRRF